jgi:hypothetical protein
MSRKIFALALPLACALGSASSFAATLTAGHFDLEVIPPVLTAVEAEPPVFQQVYAVFLPPSPPQTFQTNVSLTPSITLETDHYSYSGSMSSQITMSAVPLASGGLYLAGALLPLAARLARRRR